MFKKIIFNLLILSLFTIGLYAQEEELQKGFTVTTIAIDAQNERLQSEEEDLNTTTIQGGETEEK